MGMARSRFLHDLRRLPANLRVTCPKCGHDGVYHLQHIMDYFHARRWNQSLEAAGARFRCDECGHRGAALSPAPIIAPPDPPKPLVLERDLKAEARRRRG